MQYKYFFPQLRWFIVSIPQAVWIACNETVNDDYYKLKSRLGRFNTASGMDCMQFYGSPFYYFFV